MFLDYAILSVLSLATIAYAYLYRPESSSSDDGDGGKGVRRDPPPDDHPPTEPLPRSDRDPKRERSAQSPEQIGVRV